MVSYFVQAIIPQECLQTEGSAVKEESVPRMIVVDVGSTTTKALLFEQRDKDWSLCQRGEAPTTVEAPEEDVMAGVLRAVSLLERRSGLSLLNLSSEGPVFKVDSFLATSSAGGGLQMVVCGNVARLSAESAERAALGGGAILLDVFSADDGLTLFQRLERLRALRPDMILLSGGVEGASVISFVVEMCDFIRTAKPRAKFGYAHRLPVIYAGASSGAAIVEDLLGEDFVIKVVANLRPSFGMENLIPAREAIHEAFIEHVMSNAPGYGRLQELTALPILPTPTAVAEILIKYAVQRSINILCVDIGGATTDIFSVVDGHFTRSVSANYGMSYSIGNVTAAAGLERLMRWIPDGELIVSAAEMQDRLGNKLLYPVTIPATIADLLVEQAAAREALRLSFEDHLALARIPRKAGLFEPGLLDKEDSLEIGMINLIIGSGGVLSNAPQRLQAAAMLLDAFQPVGATELMVDSIFMLPHLGAFSKVDEDAALEILSNDCLIPLGTSLSPLGWVEPGSVGIEITGRSSQGRDIRGKASGGCIETIPLATGETAELTISTGNGAHWPWSSKLTVRGGVGGIILDMRGRPLLFDEKHLTEYEAWWLRGETTEKGGEGR